MSKNQMVVDEIIDRRFNTETNKYDYLVKWKNLPTSKSTWEPRGNLKSFKHLADKYNSIISLNRFKKLKTTDSPKSNKKKQHVKAKTDPKKSHKASRETLGQDKGYYIVEKIVDRRYNSRSKKHEYLIKWEKYPDSQNTWEPRRHLDNIEDLVCEFDKKLHSQGIELRNRPESKKNAFQAKIKESAKPKEKKTPAKNHRENVKIDPTHELSSRNFFKGLNFSPPDLKYDTAAKIVGCLKKDKTIEYAVLFKTRINGTVPMIGCFSHEEMLAYKPDILSNYILSNANIL